MGKHLPKLWAVVRREFGERVRTRWFLISTLLGPVFFAAITILPVLLARRERGTAKIANVVVIDATGAGLGARVARALADSLPPARTAGAPTPAAVPQVVTVAAAGVDEAQRAATLAVVRKEREGVLVLDSLTLRGARASYAGRNASSLGDVERIRDVVRREVLTVRLMREGLPAERVSALTGPRLRLATERITDGGKGGSGAGGVIVATVVAFLLYLMILLYGQNVMRSVLEEKTTRVAEVVISSVRPDVLMAGKVLGVGAVGMVQQVAWFGGAALIGAYVAPFLARGDRGGLAARAADAADVTGAIGIPAIGVGTVAAALGFFVLGYLLYASLFAAAGAMVNTEQEAQQASFPVMLPLIVSAVFIQPVLANPDTAVARAAAWFPFSAPIIMPMRMSLVSTSPGEVLAVLVGLAVTVVGTTWLAARVYRVGLLMYGKRPSLGELARWVRQAA